MAFVCRQTKMKIQTKSICAIRTSSIRENGQTNVVETIKMINIVDDVVVGDDK